MIKAEFTRVLVGMYHNRIEYPATAGGVTSELPRPHESRHRRFHERRSRLALGRAGIADAARAALRAERVRERARLDHAPRRSGHRAA